MKRPMTKDLGPMYGVAFCAKGVAHPIVALPGGGYGVMVKGGIEYAFQHYTAHPTCAALVEAGAVFVGFAGWYACFHIPPGTRAAGA